MIIGPELQPPVISDPPDFPELPVEPDKGPTTPPGGPIDSDEPPA